MKVYIDIYKTWEFVCSLTIWIVLIPGNTITRVLEVLDTLDRHNFDKEDISNSLDTLYHKIFTATQTKDSTEVRPAPPSHTQPYPLTTCPTHLQQSPALLALYLFIFFSTFIVAVLEIDMIKNSIWELLIKWYGPFNRVCLKNVIHLYVHVDAEFVEWEDNFSVGN